MTFQNLRAPLVALFFLLVAPFASGQGTCYYNIALKDTGRPAGAATIHVGTEDSTGSPPSPLATIYTTEALTVTKSNPFTADAFGNYTFCAPNNKYRIQISGSGLTTLTQDDILLPPNPPVKMCHALPGANASAKIVACIAALPPTGGTADTRGLEGAQTFASNPFAGVTKPVRLLLGAATFSGALDIVCAKCEVIGSGDQTILTAVAATSPIVTISAADVNVRNLRIEGQAVDGSTSQYGVRVTSGSGGNATIENVTFSGPDATKGLNNAAHLQSANGNIFRGNRIERIFGTVSGTGYGILVETASNNLIAGNLFTFTSTQGRHQVYLSAGSQFNRVLGNRILSGTNDQITMFSTEAQVATNFNLIADNVLTDMNASGTLSAAIHITQKAFFNRVEANEISGPTGHGILVESSGLAAESDADDNSVINNTVSLATRHGIYNFGANRTIIQGNWIDSAGQGGAGHGGIKLQSNTANGAGSNVRVLGNRSAGTSQHSALHIDAAAPVPNATEIAGNSFTLGSVATITDNGTATAYGINLLNGAAIASGTVSFAGLLPVADQQDIGSATLRLEAFLYNARFYRSAGNTSFPDISGDGTNPLVIAGKVDGTGIVRGGASTSWEFNGSIGQGTGAKHGRVTTGSCATTGCQVTLTWGGSAFADANYTPVCSVEDPTAQSETTGLRFAKISSKTTTTVVVDVDNFSGAGVTGTLHCHAFHD
ncbi:MAG: right-handed parallel beta-helix repeat-containing protein [Acidobacteria bacterium]|nr:right-handed parallel beta-helix repeat-containing protein [Acidobacteriota bacterium]